MKITIMYEGERITVTTITDIDVTIYNGIPHLYFIDAAVGEEWEIPVNTVIKIER